MKQLLLFLLLAGLSLIFQPSECSDAIMDDGNVEIDVVNLKALSEQHQAIRPKPGRGFDRITSSGDSPIVEISVDGNNELPGGAVVFPVDMDPGTTTTASQGSRAKNVIEEFLLARKSKIENKSVNRPTADVTNAPAMNDDDADETVTTASEATITTVTEATVAEAATTAVEASPPVFNGTVSESGKRMLEQSDNTTTMAVIRATRPAKQNVKSASLLCFECYSCKTYFLRKMRRCPRGLDMCVKEVAVGKRIAINGRNLIELEINQYCSTGDCPRNEGNITYACCHSDLCNTSTKRNIGHLWLLFICGLILNYSMLL